MKRLIREQWFQKNVRYWDWLNIYSLHEGKYKEQVYYEVGESNRDVLLKTL